MPGSKLLQLQTWYLEGDGDGDEVRAGHAMLEAGIGEQSHRDRMSNTGMYTGKALTMNGLNLNLSIASSWEYKY